jgi:hypothetical protein
MTVTVDHAGIPPAGLEEPLVVVTSDSHVSPTLQSLLDYCPKKYLRSRDDWMGRT